MKNNRWIITLGCWYWLPEKAWWGIWEITKAIISKVMLLFLFQQTSLNKSFLDFSFPYNDRQLIIPGVTNKLCDSIPGLSDHNAYGLLPLSFPFSTMSFNIKENTHTSYIHIDGQPASRKSWATKRGGNFAA